MAVFPTTTEKQQYEITSKGQAAIKSTYGRQKTLDMVLPYMHGVIDRLNQDETKPRHGRPFLACDLGEVLRQHKRWQQSLPIVTPHYGKYLRCFPRRSLTTKAVKCNSEPQILKFLAELGVSFDCASINEIYQVLDLDVSPSKIIFAHPRKDPDDAEEAIRHGVLRTTCDSVQEILNAAEYFPEAQLLIRIATDDKDSVCRLSEKFGAGPPYDTAQELLAAARQQNLNVVGVSFHVGSDSYNSQAFAQAIEEARSVFDLAKDYDYDLNILDIGGGFTTGLFEYQAEAVNTAIDQCFCDVPNLTIIGEPGRFYVGSAYVEAVKVTGSRAPKQRTKLEFDNSFLVNDGVYGTFANLISDHQIRLPKFLIQQDKSTNKPTKNIIWGPTCDAWDRMKDAKLPGVVSEFDWLYYEDMGAYTMCCVSTFNGYSKPIAHYVSSEQEASELMARAH